MLEPKPPNTQWMNMGKDETPATFDIGAAQRSRRQGTLLYTTTAAISCSPVSPLQATTLIYMPHMKQKPLPRRPPIAIYNPIQEPHQLEDMGERGAMLKATRIYLEQQLERPPFCGAPACASWRGSKIDMCTINVSGCSLPT